MDFFNISFDNQNIIEGLFIYIGKWLGWQQQMEVKKTLIISQNSNAMEDLAIKHGTTLSICGYFTCALIKYLANLNNYNAQTYKNIEKGKLSHLIEESMQFILGARRKEIIKFESKMSEKQKKWYLKDWVANYEIAEYLAQNVHSFKNKQVFFFRQSAYDHPAQMADTKFQEKERIVEQEKFKGQEFFYSSFGPYQNHFKEQFEKVLKEANKALPIIIATDILGHFYTNVLFDGQIYILDSLKASKDQQFDSPIVECIFKLYKKSYIIGTK